MTIQERNDRQDKMTAAIKDGAFAMWHMQLHHTKCRQIVARMRDGMLEDSMLLEHLIESLKQHGIADDVVNMLYDLSEAFEQAWNECNEEYDS